MSHGDGDKAGYSNHLKNKFRSFLHSDLSCLAGQAVNIPFLKLLRENLSMIKELPILADISLQLIKRFIPSFYTFLTHFLWYAFVLQPQFCCTICFFSSKVIKSSFGQFPGIPNSEAGFIFPFSSENLSVKSLTPQAEGFFILVLRAAAVSTQRNMKRMIREDSSDSQALAAQRHQESLNRITKCTRVRRNRR